VPGNVGAKSATIFAYIGWPLGTRGTGYRRAGGAVRFWLWRTDDGCQLVLVLVWSFAFSVAIDRCIGGVLSAFRSK